MSDTLSLDRRAEKAILDGLETVLPPDRLAHYQSNVWSLSSDGGHAAKVKLGNSIFLASRFGRNFSVENQAALRQAYANAAWGGESGDTEEAFAARAKVEMQKRRDARHLLEGETGNSPEARALYDGSLYRWANRAALAGQSAQEAFAGWQKTAQASPRWHAVGSANLWPLFEAQYGAVAEKLAPHRAALDNAFRILRGSMGVEGADESSYRGGVDDASNALQSMSAEEFRQIGVPALRAMAELAAGDDKGRLQQVLESFRRPIDNAAGAGMDTLGKTQQEGASMLRPVMKFLMPNAFPSSPAGDRIGEARDDQADKKRMMRSLLRKVADNTIDPVRVFATSTAGKTAEQALYDVAGSLGYMSAAALPGVGIPASLAGYQDQNAADLLLRHPDMKPEDAAMIGAFAAPVQTALDRLGLKVVAGKLPGFSSVMNKLAAPGGSAAFRFAAYGTGATATEFLAEKLQDAAPLAMQELASGLQADIPDADWSDYKVADWRTFWAVLPLSLVGAGVRTTSDQRKARELLQDREAMQAMGLSEEQIARITGSPDPMAALQGEWKSRKVAATAEEWRERSAPLRQKIEQAGQQSATLREELSRANITISRAEDGRATVQTAAGTTEHATHTDALSFARAHLLANGEAESAPLLDMLEALDANPLRPVTASETTLAPEQKVSAFMDERRAIMQDAAAAPDAQARAERESAAMVARLKVYEEANPDVEIDPRKLAVGGQSELQVREGVATAVAKVALGQSPYTALEERTEADAEAYLQTGEATVESLAGMIRQVEAATGDRYLNGWTEGQDAAQDRLAVKEAYSELAQVHATGKGRAGKAAGSRVAAVARADRRDAQRRVKAAGTDGAVPQGLLARLKAHAEWLKAVVGKAIRLHRARKEAGGAFDIDAFLNRSVGIEADAAHAAGVVDAARLIYTPPTPEEEANGIAFSVRDATGGGMSDAQGSTQKDGAPQGGLSEADAQTPLRIYRAGDSTESGVKPWASFTPERKTAEAYTDNPGFGGAEIRELYVDAGNVLDLTGGNMFKKLARALGMDEEAADEWISNGWNYPWEESKQIKQALAEKFDSVLYTDDFPAGAKTIIFTREPKLIESTPAPTSGASFRITPAQDAEYLAAVEAGDMDAAQRMVDEAARAAGYNVKAFHGTADSISAFDIEHPNKKDVGWMGRGIYLTNNRQIAADYSKIKAGRTPGVMSLFISLKNPYIAKSSEKQRIMLLERSDKYAALDEARALTSRLEAEGFDGVALEYPASEVGEKYASTEYVVFDPNQIKSADPVTRDESGNVIPLSQRFNPASDSISYRLTPSATLDALSGQLARRARDPEARRKILDAARESLAKLKRDWSTMRKTWRGDTIRAKVEKRTPKELDKEQAMRQALRRAELESEVEQRHQGTLDAMAEGLAEFDSAVHPVLSRITTRQRVKWTDKNGKERSALHVTGDILPRSQAALSGLAEYDDADGLPPFLFRGTRAPDQVAQELESAGIGDGSVSMLWEMLRKEINSVRAMREAVAVMATDMKNARNQAREELAEWRREQDEMQAEDWSGRAMLVRNLRILDAMLSAFPPEVRAKVGGWVNMARLKTEKAMAAELERRLLVADAHLEEVLRKDSLSEIQALFRKARPDRTPGEKPRGKLGAAVHRFFDEAERVAAMTPDELEVARPKPEDYERDGITSEESATLWEREQILDQFGALAAKVDGKPFRDAAHLARALDLLEDVYVTGRNRWRTIEEARLEEVRELTGAAIEALGGISRAAIQRRKAKDTKPLSLLSLKSALSFTQVMEEIFGRGHSLARRWSAAVRNGDAARTDEIIAARRRFTEAAMNATGHRGRLMRQALFDMGDPARQKISVSLQPTRTESVSVPVDTFGDILAGTADAVALGLSAADVDALREQFDALDPNSQIQNLTLKREQKGTPELSTFTEAEGIFLTMLWRQEQYQAALTADGFDAAAIEEIEGQLSPAAVKLREFLTAEYAAGYAPLAKVFERMFGVSLPQIENYAPGAFYNSGSSESGLDVTGSGVVEGGFRSGFLKDRKRHKAAPKAENAFATFFGHLNQTAHWKAHAETFRELRAVFGNPKVKMALEAAHGLDGVRAVQDWLTALEGNGFKAAGGKLLSMVYSIQAYKALAWKLGTLMKQSTALLGAAYRMPLADYARGLGRLFTGQLDYGAMWNSPLIRRRIEAGFSPEARAVLAQTWSAKPTRRMEFLNRGMELIGEVDAMFTAGSAAIAYDYHYRKAKADGMTDEVAASVAEQEAADVVSQTAQPVEVSAKSLLELRMDTNPLGRIAFQFASEARQKSALWLQAWRNTLTGKATADDARVLVILHLVVGPLIAGISAAWRDVRDDDDDELFDSANWKTKDFLAAAAFGPLSGIPLIRDVVDGFESPDGGPISDYVKAGKAGVALVKGPEDSEKERLEWYERKIVQTLNGLGAFPGVAANVFDQAFRIGDNLINDRVETLIKAASRKEKEIDAEPDPKKKAVLRKELKDIKDKLDTALGKAKQ